MTPFGMAPFFLTAAYPSIVAAKVVTIAPDPSEMMREAGMRVWSEKDGSEGAREKARRVAGD